MRSFYKICIALIFVALPCWSQGIKLVESTAQVDLVERDGGVIQKLEAGTILRLLGEDGGTLWVKLNNKVSGFIVGRGKIRQLTLENRTAGADAWLSGFSNDLYTFPHGPTKKPTTLKDDVFSVLPPRILDSLKEFEQKDPASARDLIEFMRRQRIEVEEKEQQPQPRNQ